MITAIVFIQAEVSRIDEVAEQISDLDRVSEVYSITGDIDLLAMVRVPEHEDIAAVVTGGINQVAGVLSTQTQVAFRAFSRHDLDEAFDLGL